MFDVGYIEIIISILAIIVTIILTAIGIVTNRKKYELTYNYRIELMEWYKSVLNIMIYIIHLCRSDDYTSSEFYKEKNKSLSKLSVLIETGRFYFPNVIIGDGHGQSKPSAYQGHRHINIQFLKHFYNIASKKDIDELEIKTMWNLERMFTSYMFDMIDPRVRNKEYSRLLSINIPEDKYIFNYLKENPNAKETFYSSSTRYLKKKSK